MLSHKGIAGPWLELDASYMVPPQTAKPVAKNHDKKTRKRRAKNKLARQSRRKNR